MRGGGYALLAFPGTGHTPATTLGGERGDFILLSADAPMAAVDTTSLAHLQELVAKGVMMGSLHVLAGPDHRKLCSLSLSLSPVDALTRPSLRSGHPERRILVPRLLSGRPMGAR